MDTTAVVVFSRAVLCDHSAFKIQRSRVVVENTAAAVLRSIIFNAAAADIDGSDIINSASVG